MLNQLLKVLLKLPRPAIRKFLCLEVQIGQEVLGWQFGDHVAAVVVDYLMVEELEVVESTSYDCVVELAVGFSCFDLVEFVTC